MVLTLTKKAKGSLLSWSWVCLFHWSTHVSMLWGQKISTVQNQKTSIKQQIYIVALFVLPAELQKKVAEKTSELTNKTEELKDRSAQPQRCKWSATQMVKITELHLNHHTLQSLFNTCCSPADNCNTHRDWETGECRDKRHRLHEDYRWVTEQYLCSTEVLEPAINKLILKK